MKENLLNITINIGFSYFIFNKYEYETFKYVDINIFRTFNFFDLEILNTLTENNYDN